MKGKQTDKSKVYVKPTKDKKRDIFLAYFWKYGYWFVMFLALMFWGTESNHIAIIGISFILYGIYSIIISIKPARHFVSGMLEGSSQSVNKYSYTHSNDDIKEIKRETMGASIFAIFLGIVLLVLYVL